MIDPAAYTLPYDLALAESLVDAGHSVDLYTTQFAHGEMPKSSKAGIHIWFYRRRLPLVSRRISRALTHPFDMRRLARHLERSGEFDVVHIQWLPVRRFDLRVWKKLSLPTVFTAHNSQERSEAIAPADLSVFDAVVVHTASGAKRLAAHPDTPDVWHLEMGAFESLRDLADPPELPIELPTNSKLVVLPGLLREYKGVDLLLEAWPAVHRSHPDAHLVIAGRPMGVSLPETPPDGVTILPRFLTDEEYAWLLRSACVVCLPYTAIDLSAVLFSAMGLGKAMVLSDVGGFSELEGNGAVTFETGNVSELTDRLSQVLGDNDLREKLAAEAKSASEGRYAWSTIATSYSGHYAELCKGTAE